MCQAPLLVMLTMTSNCGAGPAQLPQTARHHALQAAVDVLKVSEPPIELAGDRAVFEYRVPQVGIADAMLCRQHLVPLVCRGQQVQSTPSRLACVFTCD